jgi:hypothetical protein
VQERLYRQLEGLGNMVEKMRVRERLNRYSKDSSVFFISLSVGVGVNVSINATVDVTIGAALIPL